MKSRVRSREQHLKKGPQPAAEKCSAATEKVLLSSQLSRSGPGEWNDLDPLRATVLVYSPREISGALRWLASAGVTKFLENIDPPPGGSTAKGQLRAAAEDLRFTARFLASTAINLNVVMASSPAETKLGLFADEIALEVERIAHNIETRIAQKRGKR